MLRARESVFWPNINKVIEQRTVPCPICQEHQPAQSPETLLLHEVPNRPWEVIVTDLFHLDGNEYLLVADYYSEFLNCEETWHRCDQQQRHQNPKADIL